jgi:hypothetical protein
MDRLVRGAPATRLVMTFGEADSEAETDASTVTFLIEPH